MYRGYIYTPSQKQLHIPLYLFIFSMYQHHPNNMSFKQLLDIEPKPYGITLNYYNAMGPRKNGKKPAVYKTLSKADKTKWTAKFNKYVPTFPNLYSVWKQKIIDAGFLDALDVEIEKRVQKGLNRKRNTKRRAERKRAAKEGREPQHIPCEKTQPTPCKKPDVGVADQIVEVIFTRLAKVFQTMSNQTSATHQHHHHSSREERKERKRKRKEKRRERRRSKRRKKVESIAPPVQEQLKEIVLLSDDDTSEDESIRPLNIQKTRSGRSVKPVDKFVDLPPDAQIGPVHDLERVEILSDDSNGPNEFDTRFTVNNRNVEKMSAEEEKIAADGGIVDDDVESIGDDTDNDSDEDDDATEEGENHPDDDYTVGGGGGVEGSKKNLIDDVEDTAW